MQELLNQLTEFWADALAIWQDGGWAMYAIAAIALVMFGIGVSTDMRLRERAAQNVPEKQWRHWIEHPSKRRGRIGELLDAVTGGRSIEETAARFDELRLAETRPFEGDLRVMKICVSAAPLVGLLGTVTGMLATFAALSQGAGGDKTMALVASGISEALITTETGLVIALPGLFYQYRLARRFESYKAFLAHLETVCMQTLHRRDATGDVPPVVIDHVARRTILEALRRSSAEEPQAQAAVQTSEYAR